MFSAADGESAYIISVRQVWIVRIVLLGCVILHITAAIQLTRMSWAARPIGYAVKRDIETTVGARVMRWGGLVLVVFVIFHLLHLTGGVVGFGAGQFKHWPSTKMWWRLSASGPSRSSSRSRSRIACLEGPEGHR